MMFLLEKQLSLILFLIVFIVLVSIGPSLSDFTSGSIVEFTTFYVNLAVIFGAGIFMKGQVNRRFMLIYASSLVLNYYIFYAFISFSYNNIYARFWTMFVAALPSYIIFNYYNFIQCKLLSVLDRLGVSNKVADSVVGPVGSTNLILTIANYAAFWVVIDFGMAMYASVYGVTHGLAYNESIVQMFNTNGHINIFPVYDTFITVIDAFFTIIIANRVIRDQKRPDALGVGRYMTWDSRKLIPRNQAS